MKSEWLQTRKGRRGTAFELKAELAAFEEKDEEMQLEPLIQVSLTIRVLPDFSTLNLS